MAGNSAEEHPETRRNPIGLTPSQVAASALAASCSAIVASVLGVAGTISGAAIGSIVATTGSAFYGHAFRHSGKMRFAIERRKHRASKRVQPSSSPAVTRRDLNSAAALRRSKQLWDRAWVSQASPTSFLINSSKIVQASGLPAEGISMAQGRPA